jgi:hypothetical protein
MGATAKTGSGGAEQLHATVRRLRARTESLSERTRALESSSEQLRAATSRLRAKTSRLEFDMERRERSEPPPARSSGHIATDQTGERERPREEREEPEDT